MIEIALIGSTGSVGTQALEVVREHPEEFRIVALTAHKNLPLLLKQIREFHPKAVGISDDKTYNSAKAYIDKDCRLFGGQSAHVEAMLASGADTSLISVVGFPGFAPLKESICHGLKTCVANKESIVCGGAAISALLEQHNSARQWASSRSGSLSTFRMCSIKSTASSCTWLCRSARSNSFRQR